MERDEALAKLALAQHAAFTTRQAMALGYSEDAIRHRRTTGRWMSPCRGVLVIAGTPETFKQRAIVATLAYGPSSVASHTTAAALLGIGPEMPQIHIALPYGKHRQARRGIVVHQAQLGPRDIRVTHGIRVTCPNRTIVDLADEAVLDEALRLGLTTIPALRRYMKSRDLRSANLKTLLDDREHGATQSALERLFRRKLKAARLPEPVRQFAIGRYRADFAWPVKRIIVELDGLGGHFSAEASRRDKRRDRAIAIAGYTALHYTWDDVTEDWPSVDAELRAVLT